MHVRRGGGDHRTCAVPMPATPTNKGEAATRSYHARPDGNGSGELPDAVEREISRSESGITKTNQLTNH